MENPDLQFCPRCADRLEWRPVGYPDVHHPVCVKCGFILWQNPKPSAEALIMRHSGPHPEILLGRRISNGKWDLPGGFLNPADRIEDALMRECRREMGVQVVVGELLGAFQDLFLGVPIISLVYVCRIESGEPQPAAPIDDIAWFPLHEPPDVAFLAVDAAIRVMQQRSH